MSQKPPSPNQTSPAGYSLRRAAPGDEAGIAHVQKLTWFATYPNAELGITLDELRQKDFDSPAALASKRVRLEGGQPERAWVAEHDSQIIGFIFARRQSPAEITAMYVLPDHHGTGVARSLMQTALEWIGHDRPVYVQAAFYNARALAFYRKSGFTEPADQPEDYIFPSGRRMPQTRLVRPAQA